MKKGPSNKSGTSDKDFSLPRAKILRGQKNFQRLFESDAVTFREEYLNFRFLLLPDGEKKCLMGFIVSKKLDKAVERNRIRRLLREAYRLNQHIISKPVNASRFSLHGVLMANTTTMGFDQAEKNIVTLLNKAKKSILSITDRNL